MASEFVIENSRRKEFLVSKALDIQDTAAWVQKWHTLQYHCKKNGKPFELSFYEYIELALEASLTAPSQIGRDLDSYQLARYGDQGGYSIGNCRFITKQENLEERITSGAIKRAMENRKPSDIARRKTILVVDPDGNKTFCKGLNEAAKICGLWVPNISRILKTSGKYKGFTVSYYIPEE